MINNLVQILSYENIYVIANWGVIPFWLLLITAPNHMITNFFVHSIIIPLLLGVAYCYVAYQIYLDNNIFEAFFGYIF